MMKDLIEVGQVWYHAATDTKWRVSQYNGVEVVLLSPSVGYSQVLPVDRLLEEYTKESTSKRYS